MFCQVFVSFQRWTWIRAKANTEKQLRLGRLSSLMAKLNYLRSSVYLLYTIEQRGRTVVYSWPRRRGYDIYINKETENLVFHWVQETGLPISVCAVSIGEQSSGCNIWGEKAVVEIFCIHYQHSYSPLRKALPLHESEAPVLWHSHVHRSEAPVPWHVLAHGSEAPVLWHVLAHGS